jgi:hypothetical protein
MFELLLADISPSENTVLIEILDWAEASEIVFGESLSRPLHQCESTKFSVNRV